MKAVESKQFLQADKMVLPDGDLQAQIDELVLGSKVFIESVTAAGAMAAVNFDSLDTSAYAHFELEIVHGQALNTGEHLEFAFRDGASTLAGSDFRIAGSGATGFSTVPIGGPNTTLNDESAGLVTTLKINFAADGSTACTVRADGISQDDEDGALETHDLGAVWRGAAGTPDGISIVASAGSITSGIYRLYGIKKA